MGDNPIDYELLRSLLTSAQLSVSLPLELRDALLQAGAVQLLIDDGSEAAIDLLETAVRTCPVPRIADFALDSLHR